MSFRYLVIVSNHTKVIETAIYFPNMKISFLLIAKKSRSDDSPAFIKRDSGTRFSTSDTFHESYSPGGPLKSKVSRTLFLLYVHSEHILNYILIENEVRYHLTYICWTSHKVPSCVCTLVRTVIVHV